MQAYDVLRAILSDDALSPIVISEKMGRSKSYLSVIISRHSVPYTNTMALILDTMGYDLVARSRQNGREYVIDIPPEDGKKQLLDSLTRAYELDE